VLAAPDGESRLKKVLSTPDDYARGIVAGLEALLAERGLDGAAVEEIVHGTTVATNAILEHKGAKTALLTTRGFRDVLELRRLRIPHLYNLRYLPPRPMVERRLRLEVTERLDATGAVVEPLDEASVRAAVERIRREGAAAVAVCLLHSFRDPTHERRVGEIVREALPGVYLSLSVDVLPEIREYERTSTTVINAAVGPVASAYLASLAGQLAAAGIDAPVLMMQSNGGIMSARAAAERPARIVESGPAAGVIAAQRAGARAGLPNLISFDMGGTTAKASMIEGGKVGHTTEFEVGAGISLSSRLVKGGGHALKLPVLDIAEVGAGGGSVVWLDRGGALKVGPRSAGAAPGPACYGLGGTEPTITDANVVLGYINPRGVAGGAVPLDAGLAERALRDRVAAPLGMDLLAAARGVYTLANASMIRALKAVSTYRGRDPRDFALLAFGGSGPVHAAAMARFLGMRRVVVPPAPGLFSATGLLQAEREQDFVQTFFAPLAGLDPAALTAAYDALEARARAALAEEGVGEAAVACDRAADLRYVGQAYELTVGLPAGELAPADLAALGERFGREHERTYGHRADDEPVEVVNLRLVARVATGERPAPRPPVGAARGAGGERRASFGPEGGLLSTPILARADLTGAPLPGPLIVEEYDSTTVVPPGCAARRDEWGNIVIEVGEERA
jgi:N-methylhydantoinase A